MNYNSKKSINLRLDLLCERAQMLSDAIADTMHPQTRYNLQASLEFVCDEISMLSEILNAH